MNTIMLHVGGMSCEHCVKAVKKAVGAISGVSSVDVSLENKTVTVMGEGVTPVQIAQAIEDQGYEIIGGK